MIIRLKKSNTNFNKDAIFQYIAKIKIQNILLFIRIKSITHFILYLKMMHSIKKIRNKKHSYGT